MLLASRPREVFIVKRWGSKPARTWLQCRGIETGAPGRIRGERGATAVDMKKPRTLLLTGARKCLLESGGVTGSGGTDLR